MSREFQKVDAVVRMWLCSSSTKKVFLQSMDAGRTVRSNPRKIWLNETNNSLVLSRETILSC